MVNAEEVAGSDDIDEKNKWALLRKLTGKLSYLRFKRSLPVCSELNPRPCTELINQHTYAGERGGPWCPGFCLAF